MIGDSQWIGGGAENGHYVKLNIFDSANISMDDFAPAQYTYDLAKGTKLLPCRLWVMRTAGSIARTGLIALRRTATGQDSRATVAKELLQMLSFLRP